MTGPGARAIVWLDMGAAAGRSGPGWGRRRPEGRDPWLE